ncbi:unnamed protein product [Symbiodinium sp. CCMP2592]|nr:unnamed protein product [Symbiodinium sp. CCMP2592]
MDYRSPSPCEAWENVTSTVHNWLYRTSTVRCGCGTWDNDPRTYFSRAFLPLLFASAGVTLLAAPKDFEDNGESSDDESEVDEEGDLLEPPKDTPVRERLWHLDYARIICVACTVTEHSGGRHYSDRNLVWVQQWVLPYLYTISGTAFMLSRSRLCLYEFRLLLVFLAGTMANLVADIVSGRDWHNNVGNTVFQMAYILVLMVLSFLLAPLKKALQWRAEYPTAPATRQIRLLTALWAVLAAAPFVYFVGGWSLIDPYHVQGMLKNAKHSGLESIFYQAPLFFARSFGFIFLAWLAAFSGKTAWAGWILMVVSYAAHIFVPFSKGGHPLNLDLFVLGMLTYQWPVKFKTELAWLMRQYWPLIFGVLLILSTPEVTGRCDLHPLNTCWERFRFRAIEFVLISALITDALNTSDTFGLTRWLNVWALYAYCFHVAWARMLPLPYGAVVTYASIPFFYLLNRYAKHRKKT